MLESLAFLIFLVFRIIIFIDKLATYGYGVLIARKFLKPINYACFHIVMLNKIERETKHHFSKHFLSKFSNIFFIAFNKEVPQLK